MTIEQAAKLTPGDRVLVEAIFQEYNAETSTVKIFAPCIMPRQLRYYTEDNDNANSEAEPFVSMRNTRYMRDRVKNAINKQYGKRTVFCRETGNNYHSLSQYIYTEMRVSEEYFRKLTKELNL